MRPLNSLLCALAATAVCPPLHARNFPGKPIRMVIPFAAGGPSDISARSLSPCMAGLPGVPIVADIMVTLHELLIPHGTHPAD
jgi:tripartite-type tricarboxylate transporter receptor subunit TctC